MFSLRVGSVLPRLYTHATISISLTFSLQKHVGGVRIITAAPELEGIIGSVAPLSERGVVFSIGHRCENFQFAHQHECNARISMSFCACAMSWPRTDPQPSPVPMPTYLT